MTARQKFVLGAAVELSREGRRQFTADRRVLEPAHVAGFSRYPDLVLIRRGKNKTYSSWHMDYWKRVR